MLDQPNLEDTQQLTSGWYVHVYLRPWCDTPTLKACTYTEGTHLH